MTALDAVAGLTRFSPEAPLILVTDYPADTGGGGAVILRSLLEGPDRDKVVWASPTAPANASLAASPGVAVLNAGSAGRGRRSLFLDSTVYAPALAREVAELARRRSARAVWVVMHGAAVHIAARLTNGLANGLPVHLTVHDDPAYANALRSRRYIALVPWIERDFASALKRAASVDVIGEGMRGRYLARYGVGSVIVHRALVGPVREAPRYDRSLGLTVGVLGSTYGYGQLPVLGLAVAEAAGKLGVPGRIVVLGRNEGDRLKVELAGKVEVEVAGHVSEPEGVERLRNCFALYLNYPFGLRDRVLRQTSFPTKLSTYVQAARPLLMHVPADSSVVPLADDPGPSYAVTWLSMKVSDGASRLERLWHDPTSDESRHEAAEAVRLRYYDSERNRRVLASSLDALVMPAVGQGG